MNVSELLALTDWITLEIEATQIPQKYQNLLAILQQNTQPNVSKQPFETDKENLIESLRKVPVTGLTKDQMKFLELLGISIAIGNEGVAAIEDVLYRNALDITTAVQKIQEILSKLSTGISKSNQLKVGLAGCVVEEPYELNNEILMRVGFSGDALMSNVSDFKKWGDIWYDIGRGIAMAHDKSPEDIKIIGATKGSVVIELAVLTTIAATTSSIIFNGLKVAEKVLKIRKQAEEIRALHVNNAIAEQLEQEAERVKTEGIDQITNKVSDELNLTSGDQGDKIKVLDKAVKNLVNFVEKGGEVDFFIPEDKGDGSVEPNKANAELRVAFEQIRQLEQKIALLEHKEDELA